MYTQWSMKGLMSLIQACGGHGYAHTSGLPITFTEHFSTLILEGDTTVLLLQVARSLVKNYGYLQQG
jgi:acyl-CoA oxidase